MNAVKVDEAHRIQIAALAPGDLYEPEIISPDEIKLRRAPQSSDAASGPAKVRFVKENGFTVAYTDRPISLEAIKEALADFP